MKISRYFNCKKLLLLCLLMLSFTGFAQVEGTHFTYTLANPTNPSPNTLEFDVNLIVDHTGTALADGGVKVASLQFGVNFNPAIMNGGTPSTVANGGSFNLIPGTRDVAFNGLDFGGPNGSGSYRGIVNGFGQLRVVGTAVSGSAAVVVPNGIYRIGRYRFINTVAWTADSNAQFWINNVTTGGSTVPYIIGYKNGTTTPNYPYSMSLPAESPGVYVGYTEASPLSLILNTAAAPVDGISFVYTIANPSNPTPHTLEFDIELVVNHTGTALADGGLKIGSLQYGVNFDPQIMNGGNPSTAPNGGSFNLVPGTRDAIFNGLDFTGANGSGTYRGTINGTGQLRVTGTLVSGSNAVLVPNGTYRIGRYSFTNTVPWAANSNAQFWINNVTANGSTAPFVTGYKNGSTFNSYPYGLATPVANPGVAVGYTELAPLPFDLNVCSTSASAGNLVAVSCFGESDGSATITMDPVPSNSSVNYSIDGGSSTPVVLDAGGAFVVSGLTVGSHTITVTGNSPCTTPIDVLLTISGPSTQPENSTTVTACDNYTWSVTGQNYTATGIYNGTSTDGNGCPVDETLDLTITDLVTPTFAPVAPICSGDALSALPTTSENGITGAWSPALDNTATTEYTFTPDAPQCATVTTMTITVNPNVVPTFAPVAPICSGDVLSALPTTSENGITGVWSPSLDNTATTEYTFTPDAPQCATVATLTITVNPNVTPTFAPVAPICSGDALSALPTTSENGITGTWTPALNNTATTEYTFTPDPEQCATTTALTITVNTCASIVNLKLFVQGYYMGSGMMASVKNNQDYESPVNEVAELTVELRAPSTNALVATTIATLQTDGTISCTFDTAPSGSFYIAVKGSNVVQTWTAAPQSVGAVPLNYDFTTSAGQAYTDGSQPSVVEVEAGLWALYSGDYNQDEIVDFFDTTAVTNDSDAALFGIYITDLNGDGIVDFFDAILVENNSDSSIYTQRP